MTCQEVYRAKEADNLIKTLRVRQSLYIVRQNLYIMRMYTSPVIRASVSEPHTSGFDREISLYFASAQLDLSRIPRHRAWYCDSVHVRTKI